MNTSKKKILIVEDAMEIQVLLKRFFELEGCEVACASNGKQALELLQHPPLPHLIFLDLMMPVMDGFRFLRLREEKADLLAIPVVVMTADGDAQKDRTLTDVDFLRKPIDIQSLLTALHRHCS